MPHNRALPPAPPWMAEALGDLGVKEGPGRLNNPKVVSYYRDAGFPQVVQDSVPWCAAAMGAWLKKSGHKPSGSLMARSYLTYGDASEPRHGAIVVLKRGRPPSGHVALYDRDNGDGTIRLLGANQSDSVCYRNFRKQDVLAYRWPKGAPK